MQKLDLGKPTSTKHIATFRIKGIRWSPGELLWLLTSIHDSGERVRVNGQVGVIKSIEGDSEISDTEHWWKVTVEFEPKHDRLTHIAAELNELDGMLSEISEDDCIEQAGFEARRILLFDEFVCMANSLGWKWNTGRVETMSGACIFEHPDKPLCQLVLYQAGHEFFSSAILEAIRSMKEYEDE